MQKLKILLTASLLIVSQSSLAANSAKGLVKNLRSPSYDKIAIYFLLDPIPQGVTKLFYVRSDGISQAGCATGGDINTLNRTYSMLLAAQAANKEVIVNYCLDSNGYGLVNYVELE